MNNLLRTLTESPAASQNDLKLLLTSVKECRRQGDVRLTDPFYDSLDGLLQDLRTVTMDNRDAEAFLKPVAKADAPDYYDVIANPMDFQTMLKKVKTKAYKSKRDFRDDLDLIWSNCKMYNAAPAHPLRACVDRLKIKAERLLKHITDRKERTDPTIPPELSMSNGKTNGFTNGSRRHSSAKSSTRTLPKVSMKLSQGFGDSPALIRTPQRMALFAELEQDIEAASTFDQLKTLVPDMLQNVTPLSEDASEDAGYDASVEAGEKRKSSSPSNRPRKRVRLSEHPSDDITWAWWTATQTDTMLANGLPMIPHASSLPPPRPSKRKRNQPQNPKSLLTIMNNNIRTMKRVRVTHAKFSALEENEDGGSILPKTDIDEVADDRVDDRPWIQRLGKNVGVGGVEIGEASATNCLDWMSEKVLEHSGFQGASKGAVDMLSGVAGEFLMNIGRTIHFLSEKQGQKMSPEEIILHTMFESGSAVEDLESYIFDDIVRHSTRLSDLERKLVGAYRDTVGKISQGGIDDIDDDEGLFEEDDEEEENGALAMGDFADATGDDFFGLRELGIAAEFGLSNLTIPRSLLKGKRSKIKSSTTASKPTEPPPPYPPPPPFVPLTAEKVSNHIGLLRPYYMDRLTSKMPLIPSATPMVVDQPAGTPMLPSAPVAASREPERRQPVPPDMVLPDDEPHPNQTKMGPLGQILKPGSNTTTAAAANNAKKKAAADKKDKDKEQEKDKEKQSEKKPVASPVKSSNGPGRPKKKTNMPPPSFPPPVVAAV